MKLSRRAIHALSVIARFESGVYARSELLSISPRMWNSLIAAGAVEAERRTVRYTIRRDEGRCHTVTEAGWATLGTAGFHTLTSAGWNGAGFR